MGRFKLLEDKNDASTFLSEPTTLGGNQDHGTLLKIVDCNDMLTEEHAQYVYKEIDAMNGLSLKTMKNPVLKIRTKEKPVPKVRTKKNQYWRKTMSIKEA